LSKRLIDSRAKADMVVKEPQNPTAKNNEYFASILKLVDKIENTPRIKLPMTFTTRMLTGSVPITIVDETNLYLRNAPARAPMPNNINSNHILTLLIGIISILIEAVLVIPRLMP